MLKANIQSAVVSWWGRPDVSGTHDTQGVNSDSLMSGLLDDANAVGIRIAFHMEPYAGRTAVSVRDDIEYLHSRYSNHPATLWCEVSGGSDGVSWQEVPLRSFGHDSVSRRPRGSADSAGTSSSSRDRCQTNEERSSLPKRCGPVVYIFDSYHIETAKWAGILGPPDRDHGASARASIRGTNLDVVAIGLWLERSSGRDLHAGGFDGGYSYFGADGFSYGSTPGNWVAMN